ncbi:MAG TPA: VWA domain-containing protein, partial [Gemmatimonadaceae bacterium]
MDPKLLLDYELAVARSGYIVRVLLRLEGRAPDAAARIPLDLSLVLDRSGSMAGEKLARAREAAAFLVRRLRPDDVVSVVAYDSEVTTVAPPAAGDARADLAGRIVSIEPGGSTNLSGGWLRGHELVADGKRARAAAGADRAMHRVLLLTDGLANAGITDPERLVALCRSAAAKGVTTTTIGFGADYDEQLLRAMADAGGGSTYYIEEPNQAAGVFEEEIEGLLSLAAQNVAVDVEVESAVQLVAVHNDYPMVHSGRNLRAEIGDLYAREPKSLLLELFVPALEDGQTIPIATVTVSAYVLAADGGIEHQVVRIPVAAPLSRDGHAEPEVRRELMLLGAAKARREALKLRDRGDFGGASAVLGTMAETLAAAPPMVREAMAEQIDDLR